MLCGKMDGHFQIHSQNINIGGSNNWEIRIIMNQNSFKETK